MNRFPVSCKSVLAACFAILLCLFCCADSYADSPATSTRSQEIIRLGEKMYREGALPSGAPLQAVVKTGSAVPGTIYACASCHLRSGLGAFADGIYSPPVNGAKLFRSLPLVFKGIEQKSAPPLRPAYTEESLVEALRNGRDPNGRKMNESMPQYHLEDGDARTLVAYLKTLSAQFSPGVSDTAIRFATVISEDIRPEIRDAMLSAFNYTFGLKNRQVTVYNTPYGAKSRLMAENMFASRELATRNILLSTWVLKGPPETWRRQLEEYNRTEPVFALLGGSVSGQWRPIHQFCEENRIPCLFPNTDFPVISDSDWYTLYLSKGYYQEGETAAHYLNSNEGILNEKPVVQIVRDSPEAKALAEGFQQAWQELGHQAPITISLPRGKAADPEMLQSSLTTNKPAVLMVWDDATSVRLVESLSQRNDGPKRYFLSGRYFGESLWNLPESIRDVTLLTYPYSFSPYVPRTAMGQQPIPGDTKVRIKKGDIPLKDDVQKMASLTTALTQMLSGLLMDLKGNYYRDNLLDVTGMMADQEYPLYGRISFGVGKRYVAGGCAIVQLSKGANPELVNKSSQVSR